jgi:CheY-like chemotaxis protein
MGARHMSNMQTPEKPLFHGEVLLCEDNKMNRDIICDHLAKVGLKCFVAENGREGVEAFKSRTRNNEKPFDLVFMDIQMPVMDGLEASAEILKIDAQTVIIAMTANATPADREQYAARGMKDCLVKPFTSKALWGCLLQHLSPVNEGVAGGVAAENQPAESDEKFRNRLIQNFLNENRDKYAEIVGAVNAGDIKTANRLAHSLKSNAGYLGKTGLQKAAEAVEKLLAGANSLVTPHELAVLKAELDAALEDFAAREAEKPGGMAGPRVSMDAREKRLLLEKVELMLDAGNPECLQLIDRLRAMPGSEELIGLMESFNFDAALEALEKSKRQWM